MKALRQAVADMMRIPIEYVKLWVTGMKRSIQKKERKNDVATSGGKVWSFAVSRPDLARNDKGHIISRKEKRKTAVEQHAQEQKERQVSCWGV